MSKPVTERPVRGPGEFRTPGSEGSRHTPVPAEKREDAGLVPQIALTSLPLSRMPVVWWTSEMWPLHWQLWMGAQAWRS